MNKLKPGQRVRIREDLKNNQAYGRDTVVSEMLKYRGQLATVVSVWYGKYFLDVDSTEWMWTDEMLERGEEDDR